MKSKPLVCASIMEKSLQDFIQVSQKTGDADLIEIRVDSLKNPTADTVNKLLRQVAKKSGMDTILTVRPVKEGGLFKGTENDRKKLLEAGLQGASYVDLELNMPFLSEIMDKASAAGTKVIVSHHDFRATPKNEDMMSLLQLELETGADIAKLAVMAKNLKDVLRLLEVTLEASKHGEICTVSMGEHGKLTRMAAPLFGSVLLYGYVSRPTAPGQLSVAEVRQALEILGV